MSVRKHIETIGDLTAASTAFGMTGHYWFELFDKIINPFLAGLISLLTIIWLVYRIIEIRNKLNM